MNEPAYAAVPDDYDAIEQAVRETPRGRWFLEEFARRHRVADTTQVLDAIERLARDADAGLRLGFVYHEALELHRALAEAQTDLAEVKPGEETEDPATIAGTAARAAADIVHAAERLQEIGEKLRSKNVESDLCDEIETHAGGIFMAASYGALTAKRIAIVVEAMRGIEERLTRVIERWESEVN